MFGMVTGGSKAWAEAGYPAVIPAADTITNKADTVFAPGVHVSTDPIKGLDLSGEIAFQFGQQVVVAGGSQEAEKREAFAAQFLANYSLPILEKYKPTLNAAFMYFSGDKDGSANYSTDAVKSAKVYSAWDPMFAHQERTIIFQDITCPSDMELVSLAASVNPLEEVTATVRWLGAWLPAPYDGANNTPVFWQPNGEPLNPVTTDKSGFGNEYDVLIDYAYTEDVDFGLTLGWFLPGDAFNKVNRSTASQALADVAVKF
jgi:hypothetical protein